MNAPQPLADATRQAYRDESGQRMESAWFYDVQDRFRTLTHDGRSYIAKRCRTDKADEELAKSTQAFTAIDGTVASGITLRVIVPEVVDSLQSDEVYLVSRFAGPDLNTQSYAGIGPRLSASQYVDIVKCFIEMGIAHPGFLPRNIVESQDTMYLLDWEDAVFAGPQDAVGFDRLWYTNFLLNWSYLFDRNTLENLLMPLAEDARQQPRLVRYERTFQKITGCNGSDSEVRNHIERIVFGAEMPIKTVRDTMRPNDLGHLIADIYPAEIDVFFDLATYSVRQDDEDRYAYILSLITKIIHESWAESREQDLRHRLLVGLCAMLDESVTIDQLENACSCRNQKEREDYFVDELPDSLIGRYLCAQIDANELREVVVKCLARVMGVSGTEVGTVDEILEVVCDLQRGDHDGAS